jgi:hypothetical protein
MLKKHVCFSRPGAADGNKDRKNLLGGKGENFAEIILVA